jgi:cytochrome c-type biogenesis protein CcmF
MGLGLTLLGIVSVTTFQGEKIVALNPGENVTVSGYTLHFEGMKAAQGPNFTESRGVFEIMSSGGVSLGKIVSSKRFFPARQMPTTEAGIRTFGLGQLYVSLGDPDASGAMVVRAWWKPLVLLIWLGGVVMMLGAAISLLDRRLRVGAPSRRPRAAPKLAESPS